MKRNTFLLIFTVLLILLAGCASNAKPLIIPDSEPAPGLFDGTLTLQARVVMVRRYKTDDFLFTLKRESNGKYRSLWLTDMGILLADFSGKKGPITINANPAGMPKALLSKVLDPMIRTVFSPPGDRENIPVWQTAENRKVLTLYGKKRKAGEICYEIGPEGRPGRIFYKDYQRCVSFEIYILSIKVEP